MTADDKPDPSSPSPQDKSPGDDDGATPHRKPFWERRRDKIREEIARNRRGEYTVPTWVLTIILIAVVVAWAAVIILA
ncbi:MAG: hypothetical protein ACRD0P_03205 [Stackebrandtia sp.]